MAKNSAGILMYRWSGGSVEVLLVHPGGPLWARKDDGAWSIPKGEYDSSEDAFSAARREFAEETGSVANGPFIALGSIVQKTGKTVTAWAAEGDVDPETIHSTTTTIEWPPRSGRQLEFPEVDRAAWSSPRAARTRLNPAQTTFIDRLCAELGIEPD